MPITLACPCGKPLRVADQFAGRMVKCPVCGATQRAGQPAAEPAPAPKPFNPAAETSDDFEVIEDTIPANKPAPPKPAAKPVPAPAAPAPSRLKAAVIAEEEKPAAPGIIGWDGPRAELEPAALLFTSDHAQVNARIPSAMLCLSASASAPSE